MSKSPEGIDWKFVPDPPDQTSGDSDFYSLQNGYIQPESILGDPDQIEMVRNAEQVLSSFFEAIRAADIRGEM